VFTKWNKYASKDGIGLAILKSFRKLLLEVRVFGLRLAALLLLGHTIGYDTQTITQ
jgi:hypothetical protein